MIFIYIPSVPNLTIFTETVYAGTVNAGIATSLTRMETTREVSAKGGRVVIS
jgi:hypothetical protein